MRRCPAQRPRGGDVPGSSPALSKAWTEVRSQNCLLHPEGCAFFFFGSIISDSTVHFPGKAPPEPDCASSQRRRARREQPAGVSKRLGTKRRKKKAHTLLFTLSIRQPTTPPTSFHLAKNPGKHLNSGTGGALAAGRVSLAHDTASIPWGELWDYSEQ